MPANWPTFITNVTNFIVDEVASNEPTPEAGAEKFGAFVANEYFSAIGPATSIYGQSHGGSGSLGPLVDVYKAQFKRLLGEDTVDSETGKITYAQPDIPNSNQVDSSGNEIPFSGKKSDPNNPNPAEPDPEYADPDMTEVEEPVIDPEEMAIFLNEYSSTYNLPSIDHKISIYYGFVNKIDPSIIGDIKNLCITKRSINKKKGILSEDVFKS